MKKNMTLQDIQNLSMEEVYEIITITTQSGNCYYLEDIAILNDDNIEFKDGRTISIGKDKKASFLEKYKLFKLIKLFGGNLIAEEVHSANKKIIEQYFKDNESKISKIEKNLDIIISKNIAKTIDQAISESIVTVLEKHNNNLNERLDEVDNILSKYSESIVNHNNMSNALSKKIEEIDFKLINESVKEFKDLLSSFDSIVS